MRAKPNGGHWIAIDNLPIDEIAHEAADRRQMAPLARNRQPSIREPFKETIREGLRRQTGDRGRRRIQGGHERIVAAIAAQEREAAVTAMTGHLDGARTIIALDQYERPENDTSDAAE